MPAISPHSLREWLAANPALAAVRDAAGASPAFLVGGAVRDVLLGLERADLDVAVEAAPEEVTALARALDREARTHDRFGTASASVAGTIVDLAATRAEDYGRPGVLPEVRPASIAEDLARRDFTLNAIAAPLDGGEPLDPHDGVGDLGARRLRVLHDRSFVDDPTRALRAARYASRLALELEPATESLLRAADLRTVSAERVEAELRRLAREPDPVGALGLAVDWGLVAAADDLAAAALSVLDGPVWRGVADPAGAFLAASQARAGRYEAPPAIETARELAHLPSRSPSELTFRARGRTGIELVLARALGAEWLDRYIAEWRHVRLEITGRDLIAEGIPEGPAIGRGLAAALAAKLDGQVDGREAELERALLSAR